MTPAAEESSWQLLPWDTSFFGINIARINKPLTEAELKQFQKWHKERQVICTYYECPINCLDAIHVATSLGFQLIDIKVVLELAKVSNQAESSADHSLRPASTSDLPELQCLTANLHQDTRFFADQRFPQEKAIELYSRWIQKDLDDPRGVVWVKTNTDDKPVAYLSCQIKEGKGWIGLFGVASEYQGLGIGSSLLRQGLDWFKQQGCCSIQVVTQGKNTGALATYTSNGFRIKALSVWLHHWDIPT